MKRILVSVAVLGALFAFFTVPVNDAGTTAFGLLAQSFKQGDAQAHSRNARGAAMAPLMSTARQVAPRTVPKGPPMEELTHDDEASLDALIQSRSR
ncbi:MAG: hypothetical protein ACE366_17560 [Bradymonadia bacterium]